MICPKLLLFSEDKSINASIENALKDRYEVICLDDISKTMECLNKEKIEIVFIDNDLKQISGIDALLKIKRQSPKIKLIMLSQKGDINAAVKAAKAGINDFLPKPVEAEKLIESIEKVRSTPQTKKPAICYSKEILWLNGIGRAIQRFISELENASDSENDLILEAGQGISAMQIANLIHDLGKNRRKKINGIDLSSFGKESLEPHFWATVQELLIEPFIDSLNNKDFCGTIYLDKFDLISEHFQKSIIEYLKNRQNSALNKNVKFILSTSKEEIQGFEKISIPKLIERKEDIPLIISAYLEKFSLKYNKEIKGISTQAINFFMLYDWPENYMELEFVLDNSCLKCESGFIDINDVPLDCRMIIDASLKKALTSGNFALLDAKEKFKKDLFGIILDYSKNNSDTASSFLDMPKTALIDEIKNLKLRC